VLQSISDAVGGVVLSVVSVLLGPTIVLLLVKRFMPIVGNPLWRGYCQLLAWLIIGPIRLIRLLGREAMGRRHR